MNYLLWIIFTILFAGTNSVNSRSKNSASKTYNFCSTVITSAFFIMSISYAGNFLLTAYHSGRRDLFALAVVIYCLSSGAGALIGQSWAIKFEKRHAIEH